MRSDRFRVATLREVNTSKIGACGNAGTPQIEELLHRERQHIEHFGQSIEISVLIVSLGASAV